MNILVGFIYENQNIQDPNNTCVSRDKSWASPALVTLSILIGKYITIMY